MGKAFRDDDREVAAASNIEVEEDREELDVASLRLRGMLGLACCILRLINAQVTPEDMKACVCVYGVYGYGDEDTSKVNIQ